MLIPIAILIFFFLASEKFSDLGLAIVSGGL